MIEVGQTVGNYTITAALGSGGMGTVFLAEHPVIGSKVALKAIHPQFASSAEIFGRFVNEAKAVNQIGHDHIIDITDFGTAPSGDCYFMMEYLQGSTLSAAIARDGRFPPARALNIAAQIADALDASHGHGVIHRDLKPENIFLIVRDGVEDFVKVLDFGLAKLTNPDARATYESRVGTVMGTAFYMSPEQCEGRPEIDHRADVYALGVMLFEMLTGKIPFGGDGYGEILVKHVTVPAPAASSLVPELPAELDAILFRSLAKDPAHRFQSMAEFREALLGPERYAAVAPAPSRLYEELTGRLRAATPMARTELAMRPSLIADRSRLADAADGQSTFRDSVGEVWIREDSQIQRPKTHRLRAVMILGILSAGLAAGVKYRHQTTRFLDSASEVAAAVGKPDLVHVTFDSDPAGADVDRADGTRLGVTPLSADVPYGEVAIEYVFHKAGYVAKTASLVPNTPFPLFETLQKEQPTPPAASTTTEFEPPPAAEAPGVEVSPPVVLKRRISKWTGHLRRRAPDLGAAPDDAAPTTPGEPTLPTLPAPPAPVEPAPAEAISPASAAP